MNRFFSAIAVMTLLWLVACGKNPHAGRPGGDETPNQIVAYVLDSLGRGVSGAMVRARPADWVWGDPLGIDSVELNVTTDERGGFALWVYPGLWRVEVRLNEKAAQWVLQPGSEQTLRDPLLPTGSLRGVALPGERLGVAGTPYWTEADSAGNFRLDQLPYGILQVRSLGGSARTAYAQVLAGAVSRAPTLYADSRDTILLDDFEDRDSRHRFGAVLGGGWWYAVAHPDMVTRPSGVTDSFTRGLEWDSVASGTVLHFEADVDTAVWPWSEVGVGLSGDFTDMNLVRSVVFKARGEGELCLHLTSAILKTNQEIFACLDLSPEWRDREVFIDSLRLYGPGIDTLSRRAVLARTTQIRWNSRTDLRLWLDQVRLTGVAPESLWKIRR